MANPILFRLMVYCWYQARAGNKKSMIVLCLVFFVISTPIHCETTLQCKQQCNKADTEEETVEVFTGNCLIYMQLIVLHQIPHRKSNFELRMNGFLKFL